MDSYFQFNAQRNNTRLPADLVVGSDYSKYPMPGQYEMDLRNAGYREGEAVVSPAYSERLSFSARTLMCPGGREHCDACLRRGTI